MKVGFIAPYRHSGNARPPLGLLSIATVCRQAGYKADIIDADLLQLDADALIPRVAGYDVIALTAMTSTINEAIKIARSVRNIYPDKIIIIGGVHASIFPAKLLRTSLFDAVIVGEGEYAITAILDLLKENRMALGRWVSSRVVDLATVPLPDYSLIDLTAYIPRYPHGAKLPWTCISTSRGCPYKCIFCCRTVFGSQYRSYPSHRVIELISSLVKQYGLRDITFYDDEFTIDRRRVLEICEGIKEFGVTWTCEARVNLVDSELLRVMAGAGCRLINFGIESGNQHLLDHLNKNITKAEARLAVELTHRAGINASGYFMLGIQGETRDTIAETLHFAQELHLDHAQFSICTPLPGSTMFQDYIDDSGGKVIGQYLGLGASPAFTNKELPADYILKKVEEANLMFSEAAKI